MCLHDRITKWTMLIWGHMFHSLRLVLCQSLMGSDSALATAVTANWAIDGPSSNWTWHSVGSTTKAFTCMSSCAWHCWLGRKRWVYFTSLVDPSGHGWDQWMELTWTSEWSNGLRPSVANDLSTASVMWDIGRLQLLELFPGSDRHMDDAHVDPCMFFSVRLLFLRSRMGFRSTFFYPNMHWSVLARCAPGKFKSFFVHLSFQETAFHGCSSKKERHRPACICTNQDSKVQHDACFMILLFEIQGHL